MHLLTRLYSTFNVFSHLLHFGATNILSLTLVYLYMYIQGFIHRVGPGIACMKPCYAFSHILHFGAINMLTLNLCVIHQTLVYLYLYIQGFIHRDLLYENLLCIFAYPAFWCNKHAYPEWIVCPNSLKC